MRAKFNWWANFRRCNSDCETLITIYSKKNTSMLKKENSIIQPYRPQLGHHRKKLFREPQPKWGNHHQEYQERIQGANQVLDGHPHELQPVKEFYRSGALSWLGRLGM